MERKDVFEKLNHIFQDTFDDDSIVLSEKTTANDIEDWDSLMQITLITQIERCFNMKFSMKDVVKMNNVGEMVDKILELTI